METLEEAKSYIRFLYAQVQEMKSERADLKTLSEEIRLDLKEARKQMEKKDESESRLLSNITPDARTFGFAGGECLPVDSE